MTSDTDVENEFVRNATSLDRDFLIVANAWVRDQRIVGNPLSIYLWVRSQAVEFRITRASIMHGMGLGRFAFESAIDKLEACGYLRRVEDRWPPGATAADGRQLAGAKRVRWYLLDPAPDAVANEGNDPVGSDPLPGSGTVSGVSASLDDDAETEVEDVPAAAEAALIAPVDNPMLETNIGMAIPPVVSLVSENPVLETSIGTPNSGVEGHSLVNPMLETLRRVSSSYKKTKLKENKAIHHQSAGELTSCGAGFDDDDLPESGSLPIDDSVGLARERPGRRVFGVPVGDVLSGLRARLGERANGLDVDTAIVTVLGRATTFPAHPVAFIVASICANPGEFLPGGATPVGVGDSCGVPVPVEDTSGWSRPTPAECRRGHQWYDTGHGDAECVRCGIAADALAADTAAQCALRPGGHEATTGHRCRWCGIHTTNEAARVVADRKSVV